MKWAVSLQMRELPPGSLQSAEEDPGRWGEIDPDAVLGAFSRQVSRGTDAERFAAVEALGWLLDQRAVSPLLRALHDGLVSVRRSAAHALLLDRVPASAIESVQARLTDADPATRKAAVGILGGTRDSSVLDDLIAALIDPAPDVRAEAASALSRLA
jgi:HEAT repeat protein